MPGSRMALGAEPENRALPGGSGCCSHPTSGTTSPTASHISKNQAYHSRVPCLNHKHNRNLDFRKPLQPGAGLVSLRAIQLKLSLGRPVPLKQAMLTGHLGDADVCQITPALVNRAKQDLERGPPGQRHLQRTSRQVWSKQLAGGIKIQALPPNAR